MSKRRDFIKNGLLGVGGFALGGSKFSKSSYKRIIGSNDRIGVGVVGIRSRGISHIKAICELKNKGRNINLKTLCDVDEQFFDAERMKLVAKSFGQKPQALWDMRKVFEDKDIDAVSFATPTHWHALGAIWAAQAGKHVYVEKPSAHNIFESRKMIEAAKKYNVRIQVGFQNRSRKNMIDALNLVKSGAIGEIYLARGLCFKPRDSFGISLDSNPPKSLHYDMWLGPGHWQNYNEKKVHYNWHWFWNTGLGDTGNQGPHQFDVARWGLGKNEFPISVYSKGGIFGWNPNQCAQETPDTQTTIFEYGDGKIFEFETRGQFTNGEGYSDIRVGNIFYGTEGHVEINGEEANPWNAYHKREKTPFAGTGIKRSGQGVELDLQGFDTATVAHFDNFFSAIKSGKDEDLNCDVIESHYSCVPVYMANIAYKLNRKLHFLGEYEKFVNDSEANELLTRDYRYPFIVPKEV